MNAPRPPIDLLLRLQLLEGDTADYYGSVIEGLQALGLEPAVHNDRQTQWRWTGRHRGIELIVDLLSADPEGGAPAPRPVAERAARNVGDPAAIRTLPLAHGELVEIDRRVVHRTVDAREGRIEAFAFPIAGLGSWLALKGAAIELRSKSKDAYDIVWLLQQLGHEAVHELRESPLWDSDRSDRAAASIERCLDHFSTVEHIGCRQYAEHLADQGLEPERLHRDARATIGQVRNGVQDIIDAHRS